MKNHPECIPCCLRRVLHAANLSTNDEWLHRKILGEATQELCRVDELVSPAELIHAVVRRGARALGISAPYSPDKKRWLEETTSNEAVVREAIGAGGDAFARALRLAVAANLIDCEFREEIVPGFSLKSLIGGLDDLTLALDASEDLRQDLASAERVVFVHDTAGEAFFDRLLIEQLEKPPEQIVSVVRESPSLGGVTREEAVAAGLDAVARVVDPGIACRGIPLSSCSQGFRAEYAAADLVIAKGQAAYETLEGEGGEIDGERPRIYFLLRVKCDMVARELGVAVGDCVVEMN